ncbi:hypothetical protein [Novosphingobium sp.]|uniref:hypothetical protein n=1 Tax=Novosphingobium sp. TaxID=1874826 RepID=UPI0038B6D7FA
MTAATVSRAAATKPSVQQLPLGHLAAAEFRRRQVRAREVVRNRGMTVAAAERLLAPWAAIACLCGADLPELADRIEDWRVSPGAQVSIGEARWLAADDLCPRPQWVPVLAAARDAALARFAADPSAANTAAATAIQRICIALMHDANGCHIPPYRTPDAQKVAA